MKLMQNMLTTIPSRSGNAFSDRLKFSWPVYNVYGSTRPFLLFTFDFLISPATFNNATIPQHV
jgi:hypothetical protein